MAAMDADGKAALGQAVRRQRLAAGLPQTELARRAGLSERTIRDLERGHGTPRRTTIDLVVAVLQECGADVSPLIGIVRGGPGENTVPHQLPAGIPDFVGRDDMLGRARELLAPPVPPGHPSVLVVTGKPGVGKTTFAVRVGQSVRDRFPDGTLFASLRGTSNQPADPSVVLAGFLHALRVDPGGLPSSLAERGTLFRSSTADRRLLVVLDDAANEAAVRPLIPCGIGCAVIIISRNRLTAIEGARVLHLDVLSPPDATSLLAAVAGAERIDAEPEAAGRIGELCGYLPLAVRIAAARLARRPHWALGKLADQLSDDRARLDALSVGDLEVRASIAGSCSGLPAAQLRAFVLFGMLDAPDFAGWMAAAALGESPAVAEEIVELLVDSHLVDVSASASPSGVRYRMHDLLRLYARELAPDWEPSATAAVERVCTAALTIAERLDRRMQRRFLRTVTSTTARYPVEFGADALRNPAAWFDTELVSLVATVRQAYDAGMDEVCWELACSLDGIFELRSHYDLWEATLRVALAAARRRASRAAQAAVLRRMGELHADQDLYLAALDCYDQARNLLDGLGDQVAEAHLWRAAGVAHSMLGAMSEAIRCFQEALTTFTALRDRVGIADVAFGLGAVHRQQGRWDDARSSYQTALAAYGELDEQLNYLNVCTSLGSLETSTGRYDAARRYLLRSLALARSMGNAACQAYALAFLGDLYVRQGELNKARPLLRTARALSEPDGDRYGLALTLRGQGRLHHAEADLPAAKACLRQALRIAEDLGLAPVRAKVLDDLGDVHLGSGDTELARRAWCEARSAFVALGSPECEEVTEKLLGIGAVPG